MHLTFFISIFHFVSLVFVYMRQHINNDSLCLQCALVCDMCKNANILQEVNASKCLQTRYLLAQVASRLEIRCTTAFV